MFDINYVQKLVENYQLVITSSTHPSQEILLHICL